MVDVGAAEEFSEGVVHIVLLDKREVGILNWRGRWYALRNICAHLGAPVCSGSVAPYLAEEQPWSDGPVADYDRPILICPWHFWQYDVTSGMGVTARDRVKTYPVHVDSGRVLVDDSKQVPVVN